MFFSAKPTEKNKPETSRFVYENEVQKWLDLIRGSYLPSNVDDLKLSQDKRPPMPYSDTRLLNVLSHTLWFLPNVASCFAMKNLLDQKQNAFYHDYAINVCAGTKAGIGLDALAPVQHSMGDPLKTKTITFSCGKLTTGVTVKPWTGVFMLRNLKSPETYFQTAFRVQSPWAVKDESENEQIMKQECYVFDFALDRALRQISDYSCNLDVNESTPEMFYNQQATMTVAEAIEEPEREEVEPEKPVLNPYKPTVAATPLVAEKPKTPSVGTTQYSSASTTTSKTVAPVPKPVEFVMPNVEDGMLVIHKKFGEGIITLDKARKYVNVKFSEGEKKFVFPDCFKNGFLTVK